MPPNEPDVNRLVYQMETLAERLEKMERDVRDIYGTLRELQGRLHGSDKTNQVSDRFEALHAVDMEQQIAIGQMQGALATIRTILAPIVAELRENGTTANGLTINVSGGQGGQGGQTIGDNANVGTLQTGTNASVKL